MKPPAPPEVGPVERPHSDDPGLGALALLQGRVGLAVLVVLVVGTAAVLWLLYRKSEGLYRELARQGAELQAKTFSEFRKAYTSEVVARVESRGINATHDYRERERDLPLL